MDNTHNINQNKTAANEIDTRLKNYTDTEGISEQQLEAGLWYINHKVLLKRMLYGFLILISAVAWSYVIYGFAYYLTTGMKEDEKLTRQLVETNSIGHDYILQMSAKKLSMAPVVVLKSGAGKYDFYVQLKNDNDKWWAEFDYYFAADDQLTPKTHAYILPLETRHLLTLAQELPNEPFSSQLVMENIQWSRLNQHKISDWRSYYGSRMNISATNIKFTPSSLSPLSEKLNLNQLSFNVLNETPYNYWETGLAIMLYSGGRVINVNHYILNDFMSGEKRFVEISWPGNIGQADRIEIVPEINIMKDGIYIPYEGGAGEEK